MWSNPRPPSRTSAGDQFNNNPVPNNPYSRNATTPKPKSGRQSSDPWDWGWEDNSGSAQQDDWNNGWSGAPQAPQRPSYVNRQHYAQSQPQPPPPQLQPNPNEFFENIDLTQNHWGNSVQVGRPSRSAGGYQMFQPATTAASYFPPAAPTYFHKPTSDGYQNSHYHPSELNHQVSLTPHSNVHNTSLVNTEHNYFDNTQAHVNTEHNYFDNNRVTAALDQNCARMSDINAEVENVEVAPPEQIQNHLEPIRTQEPVADRTQSNHDVPDNQETVPDNEEHLQSLPQRMHQMQISSSHSADAWSTASVWDNQEVAPRCELDRNQYLETGQLADSNEIEAAPDTDNNDEGEPPPPGLHRMVTGQGTEAEEPPLQRMVPGRPVDPEETAPVRTVAAGQSAQESPVQSRYQGEEGGDGSGGDGGGQEEPRPQVPGQPSDDEERMVPGGVSDVEDESQGAVSVSPPEPVSQEGRRLDTEGGNGTDVTDNVGDNTPINVRTRPSEPPPVLHRLVLGDNTPPQPSQLSTGKPMDRVEQRMVLGQFRESEADPESKTKESAREGERELSRERERDRDDSDDDYRSQSQRRHRHRRDSFEDDRKERDRDRDYSSEREIRDRERDKGKREREREDRREYRKKRDMETRSPEYRSDHDDYERDRRDRRDRPRDKDRRRRSPDYGYERDPYYRDDPRKLPPRERDHRYYAPYEEDPYYYRENRSRPSSRSGSDYNKRHRDYPTRQPFYPEQAAYPQMHYYHMQQYYENMRRTDPQAYALWYERYMADKYGGGGVAVGGDRASVHSGRSSANGSQHLHDKRRFVFSTPKNPLSSLSKHRSCSSLSSMFQIQPESLSLVAESQSCNTLNITLFEEEEQQELKVDDVDEASQRSTPLLYSSPHIRAKFNTLGQLVIVTPHDPFSDGDRRSSISVCRVAGPDAADNQDTLEFLENPGPFISGVTHKNTVLQYLKRQSNQFHHSSEKLLHELIRLVIKLNGVVDMTDVADLLMENYRSSLGEEGAELSFDSAEQPAAPLPPHQVTSRFRDLLLEGNKNEALEWAMKNKDWGHALFLASKMDPRTHNNVMLRFANGLQSNDPLQTLYQLMSGREPQAATCAADKKWGDWRPHLAMMLSNRTAHVELDRKAILTLGDSLAGRSRLYAAHFCYLTAQLEFGRYSDPQPKLVLLGASASADMPFERFASCRAIMLTLCYEFAKRLSNHDWCIAPLRTYKFLLASRLLDHGNTTAAFAYLEAITNDILIRPSREDRPLAQLVIDMADKIKYADGELLAFATDPVTAADPDWLARLKYHSDESNDPNFMNSQMTHGVSTSTVSEVEPLPYNGGEPISQNMPVAETQPGYQLDSGAYRQDYNHYDPLQYQHPHYGNQTIMQDTTGYTEQPQASDGTSLDYWQANANSTWNHNHSIPQPMASLPEDQQLMSQQEPVVPEMTQPAPPQISVKPGFGFYTNSEENVRPQVKQPTPEKSKESRRASKNQQQSDSGWFGGIWNKLSRRPNNQMKLPDDKNPTIVWDEKTKRWVNTNASEDEQSSVALKPPPRASELNGTLPTAPAPTAPAPTAPSGPAPSVSAPSVSAPSVSAAGPIGLPPPAPSAAANKYKLQRGRAMKSNYVDVMGASKTAVSAGVDAPSMNPMPQAGPPATNFFVPAPVPGQDNAPVDFLSPSTGPVSYEPGPNKTDPSDHMPSLSRSSSASSLSREVTYYMSRRPPPARSGGYVKGNPAFYNPNNFKS